MDSQKGNVAIDQLTFSLFQRPLHPELFEIHANRQIKTGNYEAIIWVTGCTHVVGVFSGDLCLSEVVSVSGQALPIGSLMERFQLSDPGNHQFAVNQGISYAIDCQVEKMTPKRYKRSSVDLESYARNRGVFVKYPKTEIGCLQPFCYVDYEVKRTELRVQTFSAFPDQAAMIKTQSLFDFK